MERATFDFGSFFPGGAFTQGSWVRVAGPARGPRGRMALASASTGGEQWRRYPLRAVGSSRFWSAASRSRGQRPAWTVQRGLVGLPSPILLETHWEKRLRKPPFCHSRKALAGTAVRPWRRWPPCPPGAPLAY